ncbi:MAG: hypothetical protein OJF58_001133 [Enhydrobacter sp.]|nr:MAG: hypothetical protein OJF58_001133 [Enhydrobacter sp.]
MPRRDHLRDMHFAEWLPVTLFEFILLLFPARMWGVGIRRFTRLTNAFSKKVENHVYALAIYFMHYNYVRIHQTLRVTPAMAAGVSKTLWSMGDVVTMIEEWEATQR